MNGDDLDELCDVQILLHLYRVMMQITMKGPNVLEGINNQVDMDLPLNRRFIWIGRGEEIHQKQSEDAYAINLASLSQAISRVHACIILSPAFLMKQQILYPSYFNKFGDKWKKISSNLLYKIWQYACPRKRILLKDNHSKTGIFNKINESIIQYGMQIILGDSRPLIFHHQQIYDNQYLITIRLDQLKQKGYIILNFKYHQKIYSFWIISIKKQYYVLFNQVSERITIGRSSDCHIVITQPSVSRKHAYLEYNQSWKIFDGNGINVSSNGLWKRVKKMWINYKGRDGLGQGRSIIKIGDILLNLNTKQQYSWLGIQQCLSINKSTDGSCNQFLRRQLQQISSQLIKKSSKF